MAAHDRDGSSSQTLMKVALIQSYLDGSFRDVEHYVDGQVIFCMTLDGSPYQLRVALSWLAHQSPRSIEARLSILRVMPFLLVHRAASLEMSPSGEESLVPLV